MKQIKVEVINYKTEYEAFDGTKFEDFEECRKYENSAALVLLSRLNIIENHISLAEKFDFIDTCDENVYSVVMLRDESDVITISQLTQLFGNKVTFSKKDIDKPILIGRYVVNSTVDHLWFYKLEDVIKNLTDGIYTVSKVK